MAEIVQIVGLKELQLRMTRLPQELQRKELKDALFSGAKLIRDEAQQRAPLGTNKYDKHKGLLRQSIGMKLARTVHDAEVDVYVKGGKKSAYYWRFIEFGHLTRTSKARSRSQRRAAQGVAGSVAPRPFLRPAFESQKVNALERFKQTLSAGIDAAVARLK